MLCTCIIYIFKYLETFIYIEQDVTTENELYCYIIICIVLRSLAVSQGRIKNGRESSNNSIIKDGFRQMLVGRLVVGWLCFYTVRVSCYILFSCCL